MVSCRWKKAQGVKFKVSPLTVSKSFKNPPLKDVPSPEITSPESYCKEIKEVVRRQDKNLPKCSWSGNCSHFAPCLGRSKALPSKQNVDRSTQAEFATSTNRVLLGSG